VATEDERGTSDLDLIGIVKFESSDSDEYYLAAGLRVRLKRSLSLDAKMEKFPPEFVMPEIDN
jgi:hypothetical protein